MGRCGSLWIVVGRCGSLWVVVDRCGSFRVLVTTKWNKQTHKKTNDHESVTAKPTTLYLKPKELFEL